MAVMLREGRAARVIADTGAGAGYDGGMTPKRIAVLGSTGSIGRQTIEVVRQLPEFFEIVALAAGRNTARLAGQVAELRPRYVYAAQRDTVLDDAIEAAGASWLPMDEMAVADDVDIVLAGTGGAAGLLPTIAALEAGKPVAIANKEALVMAGHLIRRAMVAGGGDLRPVDSEHSAIWQCLWGEEDHGIRRIMLTASGGAFRDLDPGGLAAVTPAQALKHPTWNMGDKITVDCATLMNKGMETDRGHVALRCAHGGRAGRPPPANPSSTRWSSSATAA